jgi:hypothetical protein
MNQDELQEFVLPMVDAAYQEMMAVNAQEPYTHEEYERTSRVFGAALLLYTQGDEEYALALRLAFYDSGESLEYYTTQWSREELIRLFG